MVVLKIGCGIVRLYVQEKNNIFFLLLYRYNYWTPSKYKKSKKSDKILIEKEIFIERLFAMNNIS